MFTGLVEKIGRISKQIKKGNSIYYYIDADFEDIKIGDSVAVNGVCLTAVEIYKNGFVVEATIESLKRTNLAEKIAGKKVNLERAMLAGSRLDGHIVQGHVDCVGYVSKIRRNGNQTIYSAKFDSIYDNLVVEKGSIALDGISLTISAEKSGYVEVSIISHTLGNSTINQWSVGTKINIEFDVIGKYVLKQNRRY